MSEQTKSRPVDDKDSHLVSNIDWSFGTCGETFLRQLQDGNAAIEENNYNANHKQYLLSQNVVSQLEDYDMEFGLSDRFSKTVNLLPKSSTLYSNQQRTNTLLNSVNITPNTSEKLVRASEEFLQSRVWSPRIGLTNQILTSRTGTPKSILEM